MILKTPRLILRPWLPEDLKSFAELNADPRVMEYFPSILNHKESDVLAERISLHIQKEGWGLWAVSIANGAQFIGFIGIAPVSYEAHFTPAIEVGWRLAYDYWGQGYATEGALKALEYAFETLNVEEIVAMTLPSNKRSQNVMKKIGMHRDPKDDYDHPKIPKDHSMCRQVLYRLKRVEWGI